jgi:uridine phosphorylase
MLDGGEQIALNREYVTWTGHWKGVPVSVVSHGVGANGAAACFEELSRAGATTIIRVGTAGGLAPEVTDGALVVASGAVRADGLSEALAPLAYPALADPRLTAALAQAARATGLPVHVGVAATVAAFYPSPLTTYGGPAQALPHTVWRDCGAIAVEMEAAALLVLAALHRVAAGVILAIDGNPLAQGDASMSTYDPDRAVVDQAKLAALKAGLDALAADA